MENGELKVKRVAAEREMSHATWALPKPRPLGGDVFFDNPDWRYEINEGRGTFPHKQEGFQRGRNH